MIINEEEAKREVFGCRRCFRHFDSREELEEHFEDEKQLGQCPP